MQGNQEVNTAGEVIMGSKVALESSVDFVVATGDSFNNFINGIDVLGNAVIEPSINQGHFEKGNLNQSDLLLGNSDQVLSELSDFDQANIEASCQK